MTYERRRLLYSAVHSALHASVAVAWATLGLAALAATRQLANGSLRPSMIVALGVWAMATGVTSFVVALGAAAVLGPPRRAVRSPGGVV